MGSKLCWTVAVAGIGILVAAGLIYWFASGRASSAGAQPSGTDSQTAGGTASKPASVKRLPTVIYFDRFG